MTQSVEWWVSLIQAFVVINLVMATFAYLTLAERKVMGGCSCATGRTAPASAGCCSRSPTS